MSEHKNPLVSEKTRLLEQMSLSVDADDWDEIMDNDNVEYASTAPLRQRIEALKAITEGTDIKLTDKQKKLIDERFEVEEKVPKEFWPVGMKEEDEVSWDDVPGGNHIKGMIEALAMVAMTEEMLGKTDVTSTTFETPHKRPPIQVTDEQIVEILELTACLNATLAESGWWAIGLGVYLGTTEELAQQIRAILNKGE